MPDVPRVIAHLDMDAFYASVELLRYPELRGLPVVIGGGSRHQPAWETDPATGERRRRFARLRDYAGRGVATTATYEARAFGVNSAMGLMKAAQLAPDAILLPVDFDEYRKYSRLFKAAVRAIAPVVEDRGIDEIYIDLTPVVAARLADEEPGADIEADAWWCAREIAQELKQAVRDATGLKCSIGLAPNKLLAKIASELDKPDGLTVVTMHDLATRIWPLPVRKIHGVGPKSAAKLARLGIATIGELAAAEPDWLIEQFGASYGTWLHDAAHGRDDRPVVTHSEPVSMSRETTFERDLHAVRDRGLLSKIFTELCVELADDLRRKRYAGRNIAIKLRFDDFRTVTRAKTIAEPTDDPKVIRRAAGECLKRVDLSRRIRLLGVRVGALVRSDRAADHAQHEAELFDGSQ
ncbi:DNA polymerase IV [Betaproteobacteria bacterium PRO7]|nr:DNA polymerase IV [Betaproteobacteria bacterium PRO7]